MVSVITVGIYSNGAVILRIGLRLPAVTQKILLKAAETMITANPGVDLSSGITERLFCRSLACVLLFPPYFRKVFQISG